MKTVVWMIPGVLSLLSSASWALDVRDLQGEKLTTYKSPRGVEERCVVPQKWIPDMFSADDRKTEEKLCGHDFYSTVGICPKYNSTNPGILIVEPKKGYTAQAITSSKCDLDAMGLKTEAKFKQSLSCSYTPSILAYYQISRLLGGAGRVPVAVLRTMDIATHRQLSDKANAALRGSSQLIRQTWGTFANVHISPGRYGAVVDRSQAQVFGALSQNVKGENIYTEVNGRGDYDTRYERFVKQKPFLNVANPASLTAIAGGNSFQKLAPVAVQMKDVSDMILMDTLLSQQDRIGNIHHKLVWYYQDATQPEPWVSVKSKADVIKGSIVVPPEEQKAMAAKGAVLVKEMYLKDNDCGVIKENMMYRVNSAGKETYAPLRSVRHMSYETYARFMKLADAIAKPETRDYFKRELVFTDADYAKMSGYAVKAKSILKDNCRAGLLKFDIDLKDYLSGGPSSKSCEI